MNVFFLAADQPLTKTFSKKDDGSIDKSSYPIVSRFTSHEEHVDDLDGFYAAIQRHAANGHCLLKGQLQRALHDESRAGSTTSLSTTDWLCFDFDNVEGIDCAESAIHKILPDLADVSYILQYSASSGISGETGLRAHLFFMLAEAVLPDAAKIWVTQLNLTNPVLAKNLALSSNGMTLKFTLDRTVNQNDKLIYIAPPTLEGGIVDPLEGKRIQLVRKAKERAVLPVDGLWTPAKTQQEVHAHVARMRKEQGLKTPTAKYKLINNEEILTNPDTSAVVGEKVDRQWVRINVLGESPSWAYYYDPENPEILRNFKGQPSVLMKDFLPEYYQQVMARLQERRLKKNEAASIRPFVFRDRTADTFYNGVFDLANNKLLDVNPTRGDARRLQFFFGQYGQTPPPIIEDWEYEFRPFDNRLIDFNARFLNRWTPTSLILEPPAADTVPPTIKVILMSALGNDEECYDHFLNWLACIYQYRRKLLTAWVLHGIEGTGKGTIFTRILMPIFGRQHTVEKLVSGFDDQFNADLEVALLCVIDESKADSARNPAAFMGKLKNLITEPQISIRAMRQNPRMILSYVNFILNSNNLDAVEIASTDRRFNVAPRQEVKLLDVLTAHFGRPVTPDDFDYIEKVETPLFAGYLKQYKADLGRAQRALENTPKAKMRLASMDALEQILEAVKQGNLEYFLTYLEDGTVNPAEPHTYQAFHNTVAAWVDNIDMKTVVTSKEIQVVYQYLFAPKHPPGPHKFAKLLAHKQVDTKERHYDAREQTSKRGIQTTWKLEPELVAAFKKTVAKPIVTAKAAPAAAA